MNEQLCNIELSFSRDEDHYIFGNNTRLYVALSAERYDVYKKMDDIGLIEMLEKSNLLPKLEKTNLSADCYDSVWEIKTSNFIYTFEYEWS